MEAKAVEGMVDLRYNHVSNKEDRYMEMSKNTTIMKELKAIRNDIGDIKVKVGSIEGKIGSMEGKIGSMEIVMFSMGYDIKQLKNNYDNIFVCRSCWI